MSALSGPEVEAAVADAERVSSSVEEALSVLFARVELEDILQSLSSAKVLRFFARPVAVKAMLDLLFEAGPPPAPLDYEPPSSPQPDSKKSREEEEEEKKKEETVSTPPSKLEQERAAKDRAKVYCSEMLTNPDARAVFRVLMSTELLGYFFGYWQREEMDPRVFQGFLRLSDFMLQRRFHAFVRALQLWEFVLPCMVAHLEVPEVRVLIHALLANEAFLVGAVPETAWSHHKLVPLVLARFRTAFEPGAEAFETVTMCEFVGELVQFHFRSSPHVLRELLAEFGLITSLVLSEHTEYGEQTLALFLLFFPPRFGDDALAQLKPPPSVPLSDLVKELCQQPGSAPNFGPVMYNEEVEVVLSSHSFQRRIHIYLAESMPSSSASGVPSLSLNRWRALRLVAQIVRMVVAEVDEALISSGNLALFVDSMFALPHCSMVHTLVADTLTYLVRYSPSTIEWILIKRKFLEQAVQAFLLFKDGNRAAGGSRVAAKHRRPDYIGHLVALFGEIGSSTNPAVAKAAAANAIFSEVKNVHLPRLHETWRYEEAPKAAARQGTLLERIAQAEADEGPKKTAPEEETVEEVIEEVVEEEIVEEEVVEEIIEEIIEEE